MKTRVSTAPELLRHCTIPAPHINSFIDIKSNTVYLKTHGVAPQQHPVKKELLRVQQYLKKVQAASKKEKGESTLII